MNRRGFLRMLAGAAIAPVVTPRKYFFAPRGGWSLNEGGIYTYTYRYRNSLTGCVSDSIPQPFHGNFLIPEGAIIYGLGVNFYSSDKIDVYRRMPGLDEFEYMESHDHQTA